LRGCDRIPVASPQQNSPHNGTADLAPLRRTHVGKHLRRDETEMIQVGQVEHLEVDALGTRVSKCPEPLEHLIG